MTKHRDVTPAEVYAETARRELPAWMTAIQAQPAGRIAIALGGPRLVRFTCPKCQGLTVAVEGPRWRCEAAECARGGDVLELVSRALHGTVYFRLDQEQKAEVRRWAEEYLQGRRVSAEPGRAGGG